MLFPIVALVMGASTLASTILTEVFTHSSTNGGFNETLGEIAAAAVAILPLFVVPGMLKKSLDGVGNIGGTLNKLSDKWGKGLGGGYTNSGFAKYRAAKKADDKARISTGNYAGKNPFNKLHSAANKKLNSSVGLNKMNGGFGSQRVLVGQGQDRKDQQDSMALFNNDDTLVAAWAETGGDIRKLEAYNATLPPDKRLTEATKQQFKLMYNAGYQNKANSHIAAAKYMSENGKGSYAQFKKSLATAKARGASAIDLSTAQGGAIGAYRKSGRGDALSALDNDIKGLGPVTTAQSNKAWQSVDPANLHRDAIDATSNPDGRASYLDYLKDTTLDANGTQNGYENTRKALANYERMESRTQKSVESLLINAANQQLAPILAANAATAVAEFRAARATEAAAIAAATAVGATSADKLAAATATAAAAAAGGKATKANAIVASGITKIREAKDYFGIR